MGIEWSKPTIYGIGPSPHVRPVLWFCIASGIDIEFKQIDWKDLKSEDYLKFVNPVGQMPGLKDGDVRVFESSAIIRYLASKYPSRLYPLTDPVRLAEIDSAYEYIRQNPWRPINRLFFQLVVGPRFRNIPTEPDKVLLLLPDIEKYMKIVNEIFFQKSIFVAGDEFSVADIALGILVHSLIRCPEPYNDISPFPNVVKWWQVISVLEHFNKVNEIAYGSNLNTPRGTNMLQDTGDDGILLVDVNT